MSKDRNKQRKKIGYDKSASMHSNPNTLSDSSDEDTYDDQPPRKRSRQEGNGGEGSAGEVGRSSSEEDSGHESENASHNGTGVEI